MTSAIEIREVLPKEYEALGHLMVEVYSSLDGFPTPAEQPGYYKMLANICKLNEQQDTKVLVAVFPGGLLAGGVVYFSDMARYGSGGIANTIRNTSGIRLLGVDPAYRRAGVGRALTEACIRLAKDKGHAEVILHTTQAMRVAWGLYLRMGFERSKDLDFMQEDLPVFGFRLRLADR